MLEPGTTQTISAQDRLLDLYDRMIGDSGLSEALSNVAMVIHDILECERATVYIRSTETDELESVATIGNVSTRIKVPISSRSLAGHCAVTQRAFFIPDAYGDLSAVSPELRFDGAWDKLNSFRTRDVICAPAMFRGELFGVIQAINSEGTPFSEKSLRPMKTIARLVAYALYHAKVYDDLASMKQLEREKAKFMQIMVHELKSPIAASKMMVDVMRGFQDLGKDAMRLADRIAARLDQVLEMTRDVLSLADVKSGNPLGNISTFDIVPETRNI